MKALQKAAQSAAVIFSGKWLKSAFPRLKRFLLTGSLFVAASLATYVMEEGYDLWQHNAGGCQDAPYMNIFRPGLFYTQLVTAGYRELHALNVTLVTLRIIEVKTDRGPAEVVFGEGTKVTYKGKASSLDNVKSGRKVKVEGTYNDRGKLAAKLIEVIE